MFFVNRGLDSTLQTFLVFTHRAGFGLWVFLKYGIRAMTNQNCEEDHWQRLIEKHLASLWINEMTSNTLKALKRNENLYCPLVSKEWTKQKRDDTDMTNDHHFLMLQCDLQNYHSKVLHIGHSGVHEELEEYLLLMRVDILYLFRKIWRWRYWMS